MKIFGELLQNEERGRTCPKVLKTGYCEKAMQDAARKALEAALGEKKDAFSKWDEEIKKREAGGGGGGGGRGRGWGSGGGRGGNEPGSSESSWEEAKQIFYAFTGLAALVSGPSTHSQSACYVGALCFIRPSQNDCLHSMF
jgi:hypothetical protein